MADETSSLSSNIAAAAAEAAVAFLYTEDTDDSEIPLDATYVRFDRSVRFIAPVLFFQHQHLTKIEFPDGLERIGNRSFMLCPELTNFNLPSTVRVIEAGAFSFCPKLTSLSVPEGVTIISSYVFNFCGSLKTCHIPSTVTSIQHYAFNQCANLMFVDLPNGLINIDHNAFCFCMTLLHVAVPSTVRVIGPSAFENCKSLVSIVLQEGLQTIGDQAFQNCEELRNIYVPYTANDLGDRIFEGCTKLYELFAPGPTFISKLRNRFDYNPIHRLCYFQGAEDVESSLSRVINEEYNPDDGLFDSFGMTPLHILTLSPNPNLNLFKALVEKFPNILEGEDKLGYDPASNLYMSLAPTAIEMIKIIIKESNKSTIQSFGLERWKVDFVQEINALENVSNDIPRMEQLAARLRKIHDIYANLYKYHTKEILSLLELFLWKIKIEEASSERSSSASSSSLEPPPQKKAKIGSAVLEVDRVKCRVNCNADVIISNILPFMDPRWVPKKRL